MFLVRVVASELIDAILEFKQQSAGVTDIASRRMELESATDKELFLTYSEIPWTVEQGVAEETARRNRQVYWGGLDGDDVEFSPFKASSDEAWQDACSDIVYRRAH